MREIFRPLPVVGRVRIAGDIDAAGFGNMCLFIGSLVCASQIKV
jgi:hypothetical protein